MCCSMVLISSFSSCLSWVKLSLSYCQSHCILFLRRSPSCWNTCFNWCNSCRRVIAISFSNVRISCLSFHFLHLGFGCKVICERYLPCMGTVCAYSKGWTVGGRGRRRRRRVWEPLGPAHLWWTRSRALRDCFSLAPFQHVDSWPWFRHLVGCILVMINYR